jgi:exosortase D (VPLPA-CTERM-specific)
MPTKTSVVETPFVYTLSPWGMAWLLATVALLAVAFFQATAYMVGEWSAEEFSHGYLIPLIAGFLVWQRYQDWRRADFTGSWAGVALVALGLALDVIGRLAALYVLQHLALLMVIVGLVWSLTGTRELRNFAMPLGILVFMVPLPNVLLNPLSSELQLLSSTLGVWILRLAGVSVFLQGNVIDLGAYKLEVAEACSGVRYLLPLMTLAFLMACSFRVAFWKRAVLVLSSIPITLFMNSLRIAAIGLMVDRWGMEMAEGLVHQLQGWMIFMLSALVLLFEMYLMLRLSHDPRPWRAVFGLEFPSAPPAAVVKRTRRLPVAAWASSAALLGFAIAVTAMPRPQSQLPAREPLAAFPLRISTWSGRRQVMEQVYTEALKFDDYLLADYVRPAASPINFYVAWYDTQDAGAATHSPRACLPGGGWRITDMRQVSLDPIRIGGQVLRVNRAEIESGDHRELVYYWFMQRGRVVTSEYMVKWYLLVDALSRHRTDGALVRLVIPVAPGTTTAAADDELNAFASAIAERLTKYVPG